MPNTVVRPLKQTLLKLPQASPETVRAYLEGLAKELAVLHVLTIEIAFDPTEETIAVLTGWIRTYLGNRVIMELLVDRSLFGGARVAYEGRYKEINLATLIEQTMRQKQESIETVLEQV